MNNFQEISTDLLRIHADQPRQFYDEESIKELAEDMRKHGQLQAITVRPEKKDGITTDYFDIVFGARRFKAAQLIGLKTMKCEVVEISDEEMFDQQMSENIHRADMTPMDEANALQKTLERKRVEKKSFSVDELAMQIGKPRKFVSGRLSLLDLTEEAKEKVSQGTLPIGAAFKIALLPHDLQRIAIKRTIVSAPVGHTAKTTEFFAGDKELKSFLNNEVMTPLRTADFDTKDKDLLPCGSCTVCPKRTGNSLFGDFVDGEQCTDRSCYHDKSVRAYQKMQFELAKKKKMEVGFAARHYGVEKSFKDLGSITLFTDYDLSDGLARKNEGTFQYVVFVGVDSTDTEERIRHGWIKLKDAAVKKETGKKQKADVADKEATQQLSEAKEQAVRVEVYKQFTAHQVDNEPTMFLELAHSLWEQLNQTALPWEVIQDFIVKNKLSIQAEIFDQSWKPVTLDGKYVKPVDKRLSISVESFREAVDEQVHAAKQFSFLCELQFLSMISHECEPSWLKPMFIDLTKIREAVNGKTETESKPAAKKEGKAKAKKVKKGGKKKK